MTLNARNILYSFFYYINKHYRPSGKHRLFSYTFSNTNFHFLLSWERFGFYTCIYAEASHFILDTVVCKSAPNIWLRPAWKCIFKLKITIGDTLIKIYHSIAASVFQETRFLRKLFWMWTFPETTYFLSIDIYFLKSFLNKRALNLCFFLNYWFERFKLFL